MYHLEQKKKSKSTPLHFYYNCCFPAILCQTSGLLQCDYRAVVVLSLLKTTTIKSTGVAKKTQGK